MEKIFRYERDLVECFQEHHSLLSNTLLIAEMKIRWGNIDLVEISNASHPFTSEQCKILIKPSCAKIFMRLKNKRPISKEKLFIGLGLSNSTFNKSISELIKVKLIINEDDLFYRNIDFIFPNVIITGYEAKLTDYNKALYQACINKEYVDYSYMVFPLEIAKNISTKYDKVIKSFNLGLIGVAPDKSFILIKSKRNEPIKPYIRLMNLALSYDCTL